ncbi:TetR/AcrR family transcriptional regulator, partial [Streptomyces sp. NPDC059506]
YSSLGGAGGGGGVADVLMFATCAGRVAGGGGARTAGAPGAPHPNIVPVVPRGPGRRPASLAMADAVFGCLTGAGWPPAHATRIGALMRYFIAGSALGSFARGFLDDPGVYEGSYPHLGQAHLLADHRERVDEGAFETGLRALVDGLALQYDTA